MPDCIKVEDCGQKKRQDYSLGQEIPSLVSIRGCGEAITPPFDDVPSLRGACFRETVLSLAIGSSFTYVLPSIFTSPNFSTLSVQVHCDSDVTCMVPVFQHTATCESQSTKIDTFFLHLLCIAQSTLKGSTRLFDFVQGVYVGDGGETIINEKLEGVKSMEVEEDVENIMKELIHRVDMHRFTDAASASAS
ncbi:uncharacterized protein ARMOST_15205 [Armillaria ostoyae]|uniref:Uncharacterized protein n=1 Tax=Armillaria ostoyae TaxID=47428 RepID=A0A284RSW3_ARMOS|nr:uncharacterized protein ARMOST_15205 [Armillaria ostoyae]